MLVSKIKKIEGGRVIVKDALAGEHYHVEQYAPDFFSVEDPVGESVGSFKTKAEAEAECKKQNDLYMKDSKTRDIETWTVKNRAGKTIAENIPDIVEWLKTHSDVFEVARLNAIKTLIIA